MKLTRKIKNSPAAVQRAFLDTPIGTIGVFYHDNVLIKVDLQIQVPDGQRRESPAANIAVQFQNYFNDPTFRFHLPFELQGTAFQLRVWKALQTIPVGSTRTYGELANQLSTHPRAIGQACRTNPLPIIIPCHRVVSCSGLGGFSGATEGHWPTIKRWLLNHESGNGNRPAKL